jgi:hypothetical protein
MVTILTFVQESPERVYNIVTRIQSSAGGFHRQKISLSRRQRWLYELERGPCNSHQGV